MSGGRATVGVLNADDLKIAQQDFKEKMKAAFLQSLPASADPDKQLAVAEATQSVISDHEAGQEVSEFTLTGTSTIAVVAFNKQDLAQLVNHRISDKVDQNVEKFLLADKQPQVTVASYDAKAGRAQLSVYQDVQVTIDANVDALGAQNFLGKKKDEIQRYVLGLDHVADVQVIFSPSWMLSAPTVPDRVKVIVKNIQ